ncbi:MAG: pilus assembly protein CpaE [Proteobacteria bacterium]|jgi:pilus assembly protein CpaE|nr:pilus assembly protein CpaE [Pseudomonadota bacterium]
MKIMPLAGPLATGRSGLTEQRLLAFVGDDATEAALRAGLSDRIDAMEVRRGGIRAAIRCLEREARLAWLIVDLSGVDQPLQELEALAEVCPPDVNVLAIGEHAGLDFYRSLTRDLGVVDYLVKPLTRDSVSRTFAPHLIGSPLDMSGERGGRVVLVTGARGGVGASTIAYNLAHQAANQNKSHVVLLDLHLQLGALPLIAGVKAGSGLRMALENPDRIDTLFLERVASPVGERLKIIAADEPLGLQIEMLEAGIARIVALLRGKFNYVVVDLPMPLVRGTGELLSMARKSVLVLQPDVLSLRGARLIRSCFIEASGNHHVLAVVNRATMPGALGAAMIEKGLDRKPDLAIPDFGAAMVGCENNGTPAVESIAGFARALNPLIHELTGHAVTVARPSMFARWRAR